MADMVTTVLNLPASKRISFTYGVAVVNTVSFGTVTAALANKLMSVVVNTKLGNVATYNHKTQKFTFGFADTGGNSDRESLIVHEAAHAAFDVAVTPMSVAQSEAAAHIAQCLYFYFKHETELAGGKAAPAFTNPILKAAWPVSQIALTKPALTDADVQPLTDAIKVSPRYKDTHANTEDFDGV
ncbi:MAG: hypothetical protein ACRC14_08225 [Paracoccaceae bacterium]